MKKVFLALVAVVAIGTSTTFAQKAIGLRFGTGSLSGAEISYQQAMGGTNRLEGDLGFSFGDNHSYISATGIYQWKWSIVNNLNWYAGPGATLGLYLSDVSDGGIALGIIESLSKAYISTQLADAIVFGVLVLVLLVKPSGLLGKMKIEKV